MIRSSIHSSTRGRQSSIRIPLSISRKIVVLLPLLLIAVVIFTAFVGPRLMKVLPSPPSSFFASIDTMKVSRDTENHPLSWREITNIVNLSSSINTNYITVDTEWDYADYMQQWINAIRATGRHVWFRIHPNQWEGINGATGIMTPSQYEAAERIFITSHPSFFRPDDILDSCPEPENGLYWHAKYGKNWSVNAPNAATREFNAFLRDTTDTANSALGQVIPMFWSVPPSISSATLLLTAIQISTLPILQWLLMRA
jgi:hypothetical protein